MEIYLDNSATTRVCKSAAQAMTVAMTQDYGNPSSIHALGIRAQRELEDARKTLARALGAESGEIYFAPSGTAANNTAILGAAAAKGKKGGRIITTSVEHPSVGEAVKRLGELGYEIVRLKSDSTGMISVDELCSAVNKNTVLVSVMAVNNEIGTVMPIDRLRQAVRSAGSSALIHVDAVQAFGKMRLNPSRLGIDMMTVSAHKLHGPKGVGALYLKKGVKIAPHLLGGGQESGLFSGTQPTPAIQGFAAAVRELPDIDSELERLRLLRNEFTERLMQIGGVRINSPSNALPYIINVSVTGVPSQTMVNALSEMGVYVSAGSACKRGRRSEVLLAIGLEPRFIDCAVRISLSRYTEASELDDAAAAIESVARRVRR